MKLGLNDPLSGGNCMHLCSALPTRALNLFGLSRVHDRAGFKIDWETLNNVERLCNVVVWGSFDVTLVTFSMGESIIAYPEGNELNDFVPFGFG
jgi:hypothetical protein